MQNLTKTHLLPATVFITGACILIIEVVATRILSPFYGNTIFTVSSVISIILAALSIGYYFGGIFADRYPTFRWFYGIILVSGLLVLSFHFLGKILLPNLSNTFTITTGPLISSLILFFIPALLLGTLSPYAIKLQSINTPKQGIGSASGKIFFWSTLGSITGSLLAGFIFIPNFGIDNIILGTGMSLVLLGFIALLKFGARKKNLFITLIVSTVISLLISMFSQNEKSALIYSQDGFYEKISIYDGRLNGRPTRFFIQDKSSSGAMYLDTANPTDLVYDYTKFYSVYKIFNPNINNLLVIGGGAYTIPKALLSELPNAKIDVSEIEPSLFKIAKKYFKLEDNKRLSNSTEDGRSFLRKSNKEYDYIFSDVYYSLFSIPSHFTTKEFFHLAKSRLSDEGIFVANLLGDLSRKSPSLIMSEIKTFRSVFPNSYFFAVDTPSQLNSQNIIFVGYNSASMIDLSSEDVINNPDRFIKNLQDKSINIDRFNLTKHPILTDNFSPVDQLTALTLERDFTTSNYSVNGDEMINIIDQQLQYGPRYLNSDGHKNVQKFLIAEMKQHADTVKVQSWDHKGTDGKRYKLSNIIGQYNPRSKKRIILATHYDSKRFADQDQKNKNLPVPGANDSASGVAVLIELARVLKNQLNPALGIDFIFFDGEEGENNQRSDYSNWKPIGSTYFSENLNQIYNSEKPESAIILDMVCGKNLKVYPEKFSVEKAGSIVDSFWKIAVSVNKEVFQKKPVGGIRDDHIAINRAGIPSILLIDSDYRYFHTTEDTLDKCSSESLQTVADAVLEYIYSLKT